MKTSYKSTLKATVLIAAYAATAAFTGAFAQNWPDRPVRVVIPFPPGGTLDKIGRMLAEDLTKQFGQNFIVDNRPGGNGVIGGDAVAKAAADGYTLLFNASTFVTAPMTLKSVPYKIQTDFAPIALVGQAPLSVAISNRLGVTDVKGLAAAAKANPGKLNETMELVIGKKYLGGGQSILKQELITSIRRMRC